ncbi:DUF6783 domain-containing protein [Blautia wexlerae]
MQIAGMIFQTHSSSLR